MDSISQSMGVYVLSSSNYIYAGRSTTDLKSRFKDHINESIVGEFYSGSILEVANLLRRFITASLILKIISFPKLLLVNIETTQHLLQNSPRCNHECPNLCGYGKV